MRFAGSRKWPLLVCQGFGSPYAIEVQVHLHLMTALSLPHNQVQRCSDLRISAFVNHRRIASGPIPRYRNEQVAESEPPAKAPVLDHPRSPASRLVSQFEVS